MSNLFIGLGGFGANTLEFLSEKMSVYNDHLARQYQPQVSAYYYYIDTDDAMYRQNPGKFTYGSNKTFHALGHHSPYQMVSNLQIADGESYEVLKKWYDAPSKTTNMTAGADIIRQYSRLAFQSESEWIRTELVTLIQQVTQQQGRIYVITGSCGGTGSGIYMDILYMISEIYETLNCPTASTDVRLIIAMPEGYLEHCGGPLWDIGNVIMELNAFATLEELNAICKDKNSRPSKFNRCYIGDHKKHGCFQPFRFGYLYDTAGQGPKEASRELSQILFELEFSANPNGAAHGYNGSFFDGLMTNTVDWNWNATCENDYVKAFNALGQYSIEKPDFLYKKYFSDRLLYEVFHEGLIGKRESVDENLVIQTSQAFISYCEREIVKKHEGIQHFVTEGDFADDFKVSSLFSVFTGYPDMENGIVKQIFNCKDDLLTNIQSMVSRHCKEWIMHYGLVTTYVILVALDTAIYHTALDTSHVFEELLSIAKENSKGGLLRKRIKPGKALKEFIDLLHTWLTFEVNKTLSSGYDISDQEHGCLDYGKRFVEQAMHRLELNEEQNHWDIRFCKEVARLKHDTNRIFVPCLDSVTDDSCRIASDSPMVTAYQNVVLEEPTETNFAQGTCTPTTLHNRIMEAMMSDSSLKEHGFNLEELFDMHSLKSLAVRGNMMQFVENYIKFAKEQINILLETNQSYQQLFAGDILTRLQNLPMCERAKICQSFACFDSVKLRTSYMNQHALTTCTYYLVSSTANVGLMQELGILDQNGNTPMNSAHSQPNPFFDDKIVKLIVKNGYKIDDYRYFEEYKEFAKQTLTTDRVIHNPFIDKRFLGEPDQDGKYPCDVSAALDKIANEVD